MLWWIWVIRRCSFLYKELSGRKRKIKSWKFKRDDPILIQVVEQLKEKSSGSYSKLKIVEIPDDVEYEIRDYDGWESIHEVHRSWC